MYVCMGLKSTWSSKFRPYLKTPNAIAHAHWNKPAAAEARVGAISAFNLCPNILATVKSCKHPHFIVKHIQWHIVAYFRDQTLIIL